MSSVNNNNPTTIGSITTRGHVSIAAHNKGKSGTALCVGFTQDEQSPLNLIFSDNDGNDWGEVKHVPYGDPDREGDIMRNINTTLNPFSIAYMGSKLCIVSSEYVRDFTPTILGKITTTPSSRIIFRTTDDQGESFSDPIIFENCTTFNSPSLVVKRNNQLLLSYIRADNNRISYINIDLNSI